MNVSACKSHPLWLRIRRTDRIDQSQPTDVRVAASQIFVKATMQSPSAVAELRSRWRQNNQGLAKSA